MNSFKCNVEVESDFVDERSGVGSNGKEYHIRSQKAWVFLNSKFPKEFTLNLQPGQHAYKPGVYTVDLAPALDVGDFGRLVVDGRRVTLVPVSAAKAA